MGKKKILVLSYSYLKSDPRVKRQIATLKEHYELHTAGYNAFTEPLPFTPLHRPDPKPRYTFHLHYPTLLRKFFSGIVLFLHQLEMLNKNGFYKKKYWSEERKGDLAAIRSKGINFDLVLANDVESLPLALALKGENTKVIIDCHEYHPLEFEEDAAWMKTSKPYADYLCGTYLSEADAMFTVCEGIAAEYRKNFSVDPIVVTNATEYEDLQPSKTGEEIRMIHHGIAIKARSLDMMIDMMEQLDKRFTLDLMLVPSSREYYEQLLKKAQGNARIRFIDPVPTDRIASTINSYDVGLFLLPPVNFNYEHALPNKFFEFIQGRLAIAIGPSPEMAALLRKYDLGLVAENFSSAAMISGLKTLTTDKIRHYKEQSHKFAKELSAEKNKELILATVNRLLQK